MKKKSKFQERLDTIAKNYIPEEDRGSMNDKLKLHTMDTEGTGGTQSQSAQDPIDIKVFSIRDLEALTLLIEDRIIALSEMPQDPDARDSHYGYNTAIRDCVTILKKVTRETKQKGT